MTVIPNLLITGILTIILSVAIVVWAIAFVRRRRGGLILILLSMAMLLTGGGFGPPILGILAGLAELAAREPSAGWRRRLSPSVRRVLARLWPWAYAICVANGVFLVLGSVILVYLFDFHNPGLFTNSFFFAVISLLVTIPLGVAYDVERSLGASGA